MTVERLKDIKRTFELDLTERTYNFLNLDGSNRELLYKEISYEDFIKAVQQKVALKIEWYISDNLNKYKLNVNDLKITFKQKDDWERYDHHTLIDYAVFNFTSDETDEEYEYRIKCIEKENNKVKEIKRADDEVERLEKELENIDVDTRKKVLRLQMLKPKKF